jgi:signal peptidase
VKKETKNVIITFVALAALVAIGYTGVMVYSGASPSFYTVESGSMRHSDSSKIGVIDTGDMVIVRDPSKTDIITYIEGHGTGYRMFGDYGDVILYKDKLGRTIIHRAILDMEVVDVDGSDKKWWKVHGLDKYTGEWSCGALNNTNYNNEPLTGSLILYDFGVKNTRLEIKLATNFNGVTKGDRGYLTMGDSNNPNYDAALVTEDMLVAVAALEIPWVGIIKLYVSGTNTDQIPSNTLPSFIAAFVAFVLIVAILSVVHDSYVKKKDARKKKQ